MMRQDDGYLEEPYERCSPPVAQDVGASPTRSTTTLEHHALAQAAGSALFGVPCQDSPFPVFVDTEHIQEAKEKPLSKWARLSAGSTDLCGGIGMLFAFVFVNAIVYFEPSIGVAVAAAIAFQIGIVILRDRVFAPARWALGLKVVSTIDILFTFKDQH